MYEIQINKLLQNLPEINHPIKIDIVLDGGLFNGSYLIGALHFIKQLEKRNYVKVNRISGCSVGSAVGLLYILDKLDYSELILNDSKQQIKTHYQIPMIKQFYNYLFETDPSRNELIIDEESILNKVNKHLYITYHKKCGNFFKKQTKNKYKSTTQLFDCIIRSCFVPYMIDGNLLYKNKYFDGIMPHIFDETKSDSVKVLHMNICTLDKLYQMINISNEKSDYHRVIAGILDAHLFFIKGTNATICNYIETGTCYKFYTLWIRYFVSTIIVYSFCLFNYFEKYSIQNPFLSSILKKLYRKIIKYNTK